MKQAHSKKLILSLYPDYRGLLSTVRIPAVLGLSIPQTIFILILTIICLKKIRR